MNSFRGDEMICCRIAGQYVEPLERRFFLSITPDRFEPNDNFNQCTELGTLGDRTENGLNIHAPSNQDFFRFTAAAAGNVIITITFQNSLGDLDLALYSDSNASLARSDGTTDSEMITFPLAAGSAYKINVAG